MDLQAEIPRWLADVEYRAATLSDRDLLSLLGLVQGVLPLVACARSHVRAEELDSSYGATTWSELRDALAEYDQVVEAVARLRFASEVRFTK